MALLNDSMKGIVQIGAPDLIWRQSLPHGELWKTPPKSTFEEVRWTLEGSSRVHRGVKLGGRH